MWKTFSLFVRPSTQLLSQFASPLTAIAVTLVLALPGAEAQQPQQVISLESSLTAPAQVLTRENLAPAVAVDARAEMQARRANFRQFTGARISESSQPERFLLSIHQPTTLTRIAANHDFRVVGGTCSEGQLYLGGEQCSVEVVFTPTGPGHRSGQLSIAHSASARPFLIPIGGMAYGPAISFTPSVITTVPGTFAPATPGSDAGGTLLGPQGLAVDGGDSLYIADTGNNLIKYRDSSGNLSVLIGGGTASPVGYIGLPTSIKLNSPTGVAVDNVEDVLASDPGDNVAVGYIPGGDSGSVVGGGSQMDNCYPKTPCNANSEEVTGPYGIASSGMGNFFLSFATSAGASSPGFTLAEDSLSGESLTNSDPNGFYYLATSSLVQYSTSRALAVDAQENLYYSYEDSGGAISAFGVPQCYIMTQNRELSLGASSGGVYGFIAGTPVCGFSGDEGRATGARISSSIQGMTLDAAGNFYFTDTGNNRVRRIDATTGIIHTIAGNGTAGYGGDGGSSTQASVESPAGIAVDSSGRIYTTSFASSLEIGGLPVPAEVRMFGTIGQVSFGFQAVSTLSTAQTVMISNVGNDTLNFNHFGFSAGTVSDFALDPYTTSCNFNIPLPSGHNCRVGFVFKPSAFGARSAVFSITDDTATGVHTIQLAGTGGTTATVTPASLTFANQIQYTASAAQVVTLKNTGQSPLTISGIANQGPGQGVYVHTTTCTTTLAVGASCTVSVRFEPQTVGALPAVLVISDSATGGQQTVTLTGTGLAGTPKAVLAPIALAFTAQAVGTTSAWKNLRLTNTGTAILTRVRSPSPDQCDRLPVPAGLRFARTRAKLRYPLPDSVQPNGTGTTHRDVLHHHQRRNSNSHPHRGQAFCQRTLCRLHPWFSPRNLLRSPARRRF